MAVGQLILIPLCLTLLANLQRFTSPTIFHISFFRNHSYILRIDISGEKYIVHVDVRYELRAITSSYVSSNFLLYDTLSLIAWLYLPRLTRHDARSIDP